MAPTTNGLPPWVVPVAVAAGVCCLLLLGGGGFVIYKMGQRNAHARGGTEKNAEMVTARADSDAAERAGTTNSGGMPQSEYAPLSVGKMDRGYGVVGAVGNDNAGALGGYGMLPDGLLLLGDPYASMPTTTGANSESGATYSPMPSLTEQSGSGSSVPTTYDVLRLQKGETESAGAYF
jgi:hypothetical protein